MPNTPQSTVTNLDFLNSNNFIVVVEKFKNLAFFTNSVDIPGLTLNHPEQPNPFANLPRLGDRISYDEISLNFRINEDLSAWREVVAWMDGVAYPEDYQQWIDATSPTEKENVLYSDITITILNNYKKPILNLIYKNAIPQSLSGFTMTTDDVGLSVINCTLTMVFSNFEIKPI